MKFLETRGLRFTKCVPNFTTVAKVGLNYSIVFVFDDSVRAIALGRNNYV